MTQKIAKTAGIVLLAAPEKQGIYLTKVLLSANMECLHADNVEAFMTLVENVYPIAILIDLDLPHKHCEQILTELAVVMEGRALPLILLARIESKERIKDKLLTDIRDIVFKPIRIEELVARMELALDRLRKGHPGSLNEVGRNTILAARKACHELNQPLQYIMGALQLALLDIASGDPMYEVIKGLQQQSERMAQVASRLTHLIRSI